MKSKYHNIFLSQLLIAFILLMASIFIILNATKHLREENKKLEIELENYKTSQIKVVRLLSEYEDLVNKNKDIAIELKVVVNELKRAIYENPKNIPTN